MKYTIYNLQYGIKHKHCSFIFIYFLFYTLPLLFTKSKDNATSIGDLAPLTFAQGISLSGSIKYGAKKIQYWMKKESREANQGNIV